MQQFFKNTVTYLAVFAAWFVFTNHCILADALVSSAPHKTHHCHDESDSTKKSSSGHSLCNDSGCCQPALQSSTNLSQAGPILAFALPFIPSLNYIFETFPSSVKNVGIVSEAAGPRTRSEIHLLGLSLAPNAPPFPLTSCWSDTARIFSGFASICLMLFASIKHDIFVKKNYEF